MPGETTRGVERARRRTLDAVKNDARVESSPAAKPRPNYTSAELMRRTFAIDVLACQHCGGRLKLLAAVMSPKAVRCNICR
jgi:hypothetical protein